MKWVIFQKYVQRNSRLVNRGPDSSGFHTVDLSTSGSRLKFCGYVLHLRGTDLVQQPAIHHNGDVLLWNAEVFGGVRVSSDFVLDFGKLPLSLHLGFWKK